MTRGLVTTRCYSVSALASSITSIGRSEYADARCDVLSTSGTGYSTMDIAEIMKVTRLATEHGYKYRVASFLNAHPQLLSLIWQGETLLMCAAAKNQVGVMSLLLERGAAIDAAGWNGGPTALCCAAENGHVEAVVFLLDSGANISRGVGLHAPALRAACRNGHLPVVKLLMKHMEKLGMDIRTKGGDALENACRGGHVAVVRLLLLAGVNHTSGFGTMPKFIARFNGQHECLELIEVRVLVDVACLWQ